MSYNNPKSEKGGYASSDNRDQAISRPSWASRSTSVPTAGVASVASVASVAAAPPPETLYSELLRYHSDDDDEDEYASRRRRRNLRTYTDPSSTSPTTQLNPLEDRKPSAKPKAAPPSHRTPSRSESPSSFYQAALEASQQQQQQHSPPSIPMSSMSSDTYKRPGVVQVNEPAIRPNSAMYRAAYGNPSTGDSFNNNNNNNNSNMTRSGSHGRLYSTNLGGSRYSTTAPTRNRSSDDASFSSGQTSSTRPTPNQTFRSKARHLNPPELMMQIGNDEHIASGRKSPGIGKSPVPPPHAPPGGTTSRAMGPRTYPQPTTPQIPAPQHQYSAPSMRSRMGMAGRLQSTSHSSDALPTNSSHTISSVQSVPTRLGNQYRSRSSQQGLSMSTSSSDRVDSNSTVQATTSSLSISHHHTPGSGLRQPQRPRPSFDPRPSLTHPNPAAPLLDDPDMDDDLRMALEISKHDTGRMPRSEYPSQGVSPRPSMESPVARPTSFGGRTRSLTPADLEGSRMGRPNSMTVDLDDPTTEADPQSSFTRDAMAHAMHGASSTSLRDLMLALKLSEESTNLEDLLAWEQERENTTDEETPNMTDYVAAGIATNATQTTRPTTSAPASASSMPLSTPSRSRMSSLTPSTTAASDQARIWNKIRQEQEQKELELALEASKKEEKARGLGSDTSSTTTRTDDRPSSTLTRTPSLDSEGRRRELLRRGTNETEQAILSGQSHMVICRGCNGRLQAPLGYSLVYCPECQTISPA